MGGGGKGGQSDGAGEIGREAGRRINDYLNMARSLQGPLAQRYYNFLVPGEGNTGFDVTQMPSYWPMRNKTEDAYGTASSNIIANMQPGGGMGRALAQNDLGRARSISDLSGQMAQDEYNKAYGFATGSIPSATQLSSQMMAANANESAGKSGAMGGLGSGLGMMIGMGKGGGGGAGGSVGGTMSQSGWMW